MPRRGANFYSKLFCAILFFIAAAASYNGFYNRWHFHEEGAAGAWADKEIGLDKILDGAGQRPYVYRQLIPDFANWVDGEIPQQIKVPLIAAKLKSQQNPFVTPLILSPLTLNGSYLLRYYIVYLADFFFVLLAVYAMHLVCRSYGFPPVAAVLAPVIMLLLFPYFLNWAGYYYDYPELAFFALALWMGRRYNWLWLLPLAALATWNKESFLFFVPTLYPILRGRNSRLNSLLGVASLGLVSAAVYFAIRAHFLLNPGGAVEVHWQEQLALLLHPWRLAVSVDRVYGMYSLNSFSLLPLAMIAWTVQRGWRRFPVEFRDHAKIAAAINLPLFFLFCKPCEMRDLSMLYMVLLMGIAANLEELFVTSSQDSMGAL